MNGLHILFLSDNFYPEVNAPANRTHEHCKEWVKKGIEVTVITCVPNFPKGKVYKGYSNRLYQEEYIDNIRVIRVWSYIAENKGIIKRMLDYLSFMFMAIIASIFIRKVDIIIGTSPQFFTVCAASVISKMKKVPWVFELRDLWPDSITAVGALKNHFLINLLKKIESFLYNDADLIVSVTQSFKNILIARGIEKSKIKVITNGVNLEAFKKSEKNKKLLNELDLEGKFVIGYIGTIGLAHNLETILKTLNIINQTNKNNKIVVIVLGEGAEKNKLKKLAKYLNLENILFIDSVSRKEISKYWSLLDFSLTHLRDNKIFKTVIPSKMFESIAMGIPILHGVQGESSDIVVKENIGYVFKSEDHLDLLEKIRVITSNKKNYSHLKKNCLNAAIKYDRTILANNMIHEIRKLK